MDTLNYNIINELNLIFDTIFKNTKSESLEDIRAKRLYFKSKYKKIKEREED